jgi:hypothetical protein
MLVATHPVHPTVLRIQNRVQALRARAFRAPVASVPAPIAAPVVKAWTAPVDSYDYDAAFPAGRPELTPSIWSDAYAEISLGTPAAEKTVNALALDFQVEIIDRAIDLENNLDASQAERTELREKLASWHELEIDSNSCGMGSNWTQEIEAAQTRIKELDVLLEARDIAAEIKAEAEAATEADYNQRGMLLARVDKLREAAKTADWFNAKAECRDLIAAAEKEIAELDVRLEGDCRPRVAILSDREKASFESQGKVNERNALPFWRFYNQRQVKNNRLNSYLRDTPATDRQKQFAADIAGGWSELKAIIGAGELSRLRNAEASALIKFLQAGQPEI